MPRKVKRDVQVTGELKMQHEVFFNEKLSNRTSLKRVRHDEVSDSKSENLFKSVNGTDIDATNGETRSTRCDMNSSCQDSMHNRLNESALSHFMDLEERKDLLINSIDDDPLCINGPEAYDDIGWAPIKEEAVENIEASRLTITDIPLKCVVEPQVRSSSPVSSMISYVPVGENTIVKVSTDTKSSRNLYRFDSDKNDRTSNRSWWNHDKGNGNCDNGLKIDSESSKHKIRPHHCEICSKKFSSKGSLRIHKKKKHQIDIKFSCELCSLSCELQRDLIRHRNKEHRDKSGRFVCKDCGKYINDYRSFLIHLKAHYEDEMFFGEGDDDKRRFRCDECDKVFNREERLSFHKVMIHDGDTLFGEKLKRHEKSFVCHTCGKKFAFDCLLRDHVNLHTGTKPYLCQSCGRSFAQKASLKQHARTHNSVRPFSCSVCNRGFFCKGDLKKHARKHTGERPYVCEICGDGFSQSSHLGVHRRSHTGERPFECDVCSRGFTKKGDVVRHRRIHTGELPYLCQVCGKAFRQSTQCSNHIKNHHPDSFAFTSRNPAAVSQWSL